ncbi:MAG: hypothetical protein Q7S92_03330 [Candidatus Diapherotrites archaeon]|nr:hypothetical protein [Candidatus Diapherotrites archaeon]
MMKRILGLLGILILLALPGFSYYSLDTSYSKGNDYQNVSVYNAGSQSIQVSYRKGNETFSGALYDSGQFNNTGYYPCYPYANCMTVSPRPYYVDYDGSYSMYNRMSYGNSYAGYGYGYPSYGYGNNYRSGVYGYYTQNGFYPTSSYTARLPAPAYCTGYWCFN